MALLLLLRRAAARAGRPSPRSPSTTACGRRAPARRRRWRRSAPRAAIRTRPGAGRAGTARATCRTGRGRRGGALIADWARGARHRRRGARPHARRSGGDGGDAARPRLRGRRADRDGRGGREPKGSLWLRPLLGVRRAALRGWLEAEGVAWAEDPSNADPRFDRVRARAALPAARGARHRAGAAGGDGAGDGAGARGAGAAHRRRWRPPASPTGPAGRPAARSGAARGGAGGAAAAAARRRRSAGSSGAVYRPRLVRLEAALAAVEAGQGRPRADAARLRAARPRRADRHPPRARAGGAGGAAGGAGAGTGAGRSRERRRPGDGLTIGALGAGRAGAARGGQPAGVAREALATTPGDLARGELVAAPVARPEAGFSFRRVSAVTPPWAPGDSALNPGRQALMLGRKTRGPCVRPAGRSRRRRTWVTPRISPSGSSCFC